MTKSIEEQAREFVANYNEIDIDDVDEFSTDLQLYLEGAKARDAQWIKIVNELRDTINWCQDQCGYASPWWVKFNETKTKADQMLKEMGMK